MDIEKIIQEGALFKKATEKQELENKIKTKAKKTTYVKGLHGSGSAKMKAEYKRKRAARGKNKQ